MTQYICGHKIPDSDSIVSAISLSYLLNKLGENAIAVRQGEINPETDFILKSFDFDIPELKTSFANENVWLTDHSDIAQAPDDISKATIVGIVDHHKLGDITTHTPLDAWIRAVGCTNTIVKDMYDFYRVDIPKDIASIMIAAILSDTVIFKSPTCTKADTKAVRELALIADIKDYKAFGLEMFKVKSAVEGTSMNELVMRDFKDFNMNGKKIGIGQLEVVDGSIFDNIKDDLILEMSRIKEEGNRDTVLLLLTDIMVEGSEILVASNSTKMIQKAFNRKIVDNRFWLDGCLSRKKQIIPFLEKETTNTN